VSPRWGRFRLGRGVAAILVVAVIAAVALVRHLRAPRLTPELRGHQLAQRLGCFACHGPGGTGGIPNPGSDENEIPAWDGGTAMMYVESEQEIQEWILGGAPRRLAQREGGRKGEEGETDSAAALPLRMPAYRDLVSGRDLDDLVAYYKAVADYGEMPQDAREGYRAARRLGCFGCHGPGGLVGASNPRAFKGYIPPWRGGDFHELVRNEAELRAWIRDGSIPRLERSRAARFFTQREIIRMPAYRSVLAAGELDALVAYVDWVSSR